MWKQLNTKRKGTQNTKDNGKDKQTQTRYNTHTDTHTGHSSFVLLYPPSYPRQLFLSSQQMFKDSGICWIMTFYPSSNLAETITSQVLGSMRMCGNDLQVRRGGSLQRTCCRNSRAHSINVAATAGLHMTEALQLSEEMCKRIKGCLQGSLNLKAIDFLYL